MASFVDKDGELLDWDFNEYGKTFSAPKEAEVCLFPSKSMRDWSRFAWKKGDVLIMDVYRVVFDKWLNDDYTRFNAVHLITSIGGYIDKPLQNRYSPISNFITRNWRKMTDAETKIYMDSLERECGGKLNRETLEIEKSEKLAFEIGKLYVFSETDEDGEVTVIGELIGKYESDDTLRFGNQYEIETEKFVTDQAFELKISVHEELREATENEAITFHAACSLLEEKLKEKKSKEHPCFKPFDKVLVRCGKGCQWVPAFFVRFRGEDFAWRFNALTLNGNVGDFASCIPYEGHENFAFTDYDFVDLPF